MDQSLMTQAVSALSTIVIGVFGCVGWFWLSNLALDAALPPRGEKIGRNLALAAAIRPWLFLGPALIALGVYLVYPIFVSIWLSFHDTRGDAFVGLANYRWLLADSKFHESLRNNALWLVVVPSFSTLCGLIAAALTDRIRWGNLAKSLIFMPMAVSFVGAAVVWKFVYDYRGEGQPEIGLLSALVTHLGGTAQAWLTVPGWNSILLMVVLIWIQTGFAMVILSAALRGIPEETVEAATIDGATPLQIFFRIKVPQIWGTIAVVWTTITITVLKVFDIVLTMTNGQWGTQVMANLMFDWMFRANDSGRASTVALVIMLLVTPIMIWNIRNANREMR
ncbi:maltose ABC transporter membrane protein /trehalose ABC transporter membrane protein /sucrose ABC transporter membrane protein [Rhodobacter viridis]|uniref:Maltose ABC transporter membrane protein /trehalose ABC transporter membrane protein /sucrose ABC transporter membrane protein n=2 Tax=Rhodobacter viridis TaxID=1054202 RepID=A0A318UAQ8_9RHOB|nr:maltose ABC transporter membrane protein /trehalose ABC transporter membrane protein /sucrose ABC transporter membrane protein [Rhodobacter viridis]